MIERVLGSPTKIKIILTLQQHGEMNLTELVKRVGTTHRTTIEQLNQLIRYGVVEVRQIGRMKLYRLARDEAVIKTAEALAKLDKWLAQTSPQHPPTLRNLSKNT
ncbi:winged helix-turn-helix domain-containing protein [Pyrobaculum sp. 3827-6]|uniref:winged helix-turn-helix domain-containing protein n=1 Tax=Pyrobaculum sp. 3827-6 TaxID=2983604 RepID=UPI0021DAADE7|nr:winged helix-turn-helix domain-containing protein [Pyrobaculum sp. 3827-6]MCU7787819.1 winged helix-turn-helix domain-containing protein [Pyrobaculum sp. 3827-6]